MEINWTSIITTTLAVIGVVVGAATAYLRLFISKELNQTSDVILKHIDEKFAQKEMVNSNKELTQLAINTVTRSVERLDERMDKYEEKLEKLK